MALENRSPDYESVEVTTPSPGFTAGDMDVIEDTIGVYMRDCTTGNPVAFLYKSAKIELPKDTTSGVTFAIGDKVYFDSSASKVTNETSGTTLVGIALEAAVAADTSVLCSFNGKPLA